MEDRAVGFVGSASMTLIAFVGLLGAATAIVVLDLIANGIDILFTAMLSAVSSFDLLRAIVAFLSAGLPLGSVVARVGSGKNEWACSRAPMFYSIAVQ